METLYTNVERYTLNTWLKGLIYGGFKHFNKIIIDANDYVGESILQIGKQHTQMWKGT